MSRCLLASLPAELGRLQQFGSKERTSVVIDSALKPVPAVSCTANGAGGQGLQWRQWQSMTVFRHDEAVYQREIQILPKTWWGFYLTAELNKFCFLQYEASHSFLTPLVAPYFVHFCWFSFLIALTFGGKGEGTSSVLLCCFLPKKVKLLYVLVLLRSSKGLFWGFMYDFLFCLFFFGCCCYFYSAFQDAPFCQRRIYIL